MVNRPPSHPLVAWEEVGVPQESSSPPEPHEVCAVQPLQADASWLAVYEEEQETVDFIQAFLKSSGKEETEKMQFLKRICTLCRAARHKGLLQGLDVFCHRFELAKSIKALLEEEPRDQLRTAVRQLAMDAIAALSSVETVLEGQKESLIHACFTSVFSLPPEEDMQGLDASLYCQTLDAMDSMLRVLVFSSPASGLSKELQTVLKMLLTLTNSQSAAVRTRALRRIQRLSHVLARWPSLEAWQDEFSHGCYTEVQIPILGRLLGCLILLSSCKEEESSHVASDALDSIYRFICKRESRTRSEDKPQHQQAQREWEAESTSSCSLLHKASTLIMAGKNYLRPSEKTGIVLTAIEAMRHSSTYDKQVARAVLNRTMRDPASWLTDVPSIVRCIHESLQSTSTVSAWESLEALLVFLACKYPRELVFSMVINVPLCDSAALSMWGLMLFQNKTPAKFLPELKTIVNSRKRRHRKLISTAVLHACNIQEAVQDCTNAERLRFSSTQLLQEHLRGPNLGLHWLVLKGLITLSERPKTAGKIQVLLPDVVETLQDANKRMALLVFQNMVHYMKRKKASHTALQFSEKLLLLFDDECSQLRETSICLFKDLMEAVVWCDRRRMKTKVWRGLLPLFFHMSDQSPSVAKVSRKALAVVAKILEWEELRHVICPQHTQRITECLLVQDSSRVEEYLQQSLPYLKDAQAPLREAAVALVAASLSPTPLSCCSSPGSAL
ncbi:maestro heat-like repeat-containing protein family member 1 [Phalacrocorax aristotelis]|uniref:maestro heat-like repeat-containing protein family member 1 n=1 Tax=Phalacrocorax aristotelis TaxID=126867 RepID=UPI003F4B87E0